MHAYLQGSPASHRHTRLTQVKQDFYHLLLALDEGNLFAARQAFAAIAQLLPPDTASVRPIAHDGPARADLRAFAQALHQGDLPAAQSTFDRFRRDIAALRQRTSH